MATTARDLTYRPSPTDTFEVRRLAWSRRIQALVAPTRELAFGRPTWRGRLHLWAFVVAVPAGLLLTMSTQSVAHRSAGAIYSATLLLMFGTSASYHRLTRTERARRFMQKLDHSMIYALIVGTATPVCVVALPPGWRWAFLVTQVSLAGIGIGFTLTAFDRSRKIVYALYPVMTASILVAGPLLLRELSLAQAALLAGGIAAYAVGAPVLVRRRPDPWPQSFGYHEVFHAATLLGASLHFLAIRDLLV